MDDDDLFHQLMKSLGVKPLDGRGAAPGQGSVPGTAEPAAPKEKPAVRRGRRPERAHVPDAEDSLFLSTMEDFHKPPDKDRRAPLPAPEMRQIKPSKSRGAEPEATLDLHGQTTAEALASLHRFVAASAAERLKTVIVVTGKGLRSERGVSVLKDAVERWLRMRGKKWVQAFSEAPRVMGGRGAYILYLR